MRVDGKLVAIKSHGRNIVFAVVDEKGNTIEIPNFDEWLLARLGRTMDFYITDSVYSIVERRVAKSWVMTTEESRNEVE